MGYLTIYSLEILKNGEGLDYEKEIIEFSKDCATFKDSCKWYDWQEDMQEYSKKYPTTLFKLSGEGEDKGDLWVAYFLNGKVQYEKAKITYGEFNPEKLTE